MHSQVTDVNDADYGTDFRITFTSDDTFNVETFDGTNWTAVPAQTSVAYTGNIGDSAQQVSFAGVTIELEGTPVGGVNGDSILVAQAGGEQREPNLSVQWSRRSAYWKILLTIRPESRSA